MFTLAARTRGKHIPLLRSSFTLQRCRQYSNSPKHFKVTLDGGTLYIEQGVAEALGWTQDTPVDGVSLRLSGWGPHYFAITQKGTDAGTLQLTACATRLSDFLCRSSRSRHGGKQS